MRLTDAGETAWEKVWAPLNRRRAKLIRSQPLLWQEMRELHYLERVADCLLEMVEMPMPMRSLEEMCGCPEFARKIYAEVERRDIARRQAGWKAEVVL